MKHSAVRRGTGRGGTKEFGKSKRSALTSVAGFENKRCSSGHLHAIKPKENCGGGPARPDYYGRAAAVSRRDFAEPDTANRRSSAV